MSSGKPPHFFNMNELEKTRRRAEEKARERAKDRKREKSPEREYYDRKTGERLIHPGYNEKSSIPIEVKAFVIPDDTMNFMRNLSRKIDNNKYDADEVTTLAIEAGVKARENYRNSSAKLSVVA